MTYLSRKLLASALAGTLLAFSAHAATLNIHNGGDPTSLDPQKISGDWENRIDGDIFEGLVTEDPKDNPIPGQAESWTISEDGKVYTFKLHTGVKFHDGTDFDANDVKFSLDRARAENSQNAQKQLFAAIDTVEVVDPATVKVTLNGQPAKVTDLVAGDLLRVAVSSGNKVMSVAAMRAAP